VHAFIRAPFDRYVHDNSRFWNASGASLQLGANGLRLQVESLRAVVLGGIAFETPDDPDVTGESESNHSFPLYLNKDAADASTYKRSVPFVTNFTGSVAGLAAGSPVTLHGIKIGEVSSLSLLYDRSIDNVVVPVHFTLEPGRIAMLDLPTDGSLDAKMQQLVQRGMRVKLESANILTGQKQLSMDIFPNPPPAKLEKQGDDYVLPAIGDDGGDIASAAASLMSRLSDLPFESIGKNLDQTLAGVNALVNDKQLTQSIASLRATLASAQVLVSNLNHGVTPLTQRLPAIAAGLEDSVKHTNALIGSLDTGYGGDSRFSRDVTRLMSQLSDAARSLRVLADLLTRHPEALIRGRTDTGEQ
jgi:paraquat-inducible protein B